MKNITLVMVAALAAVTMLSAVLAVAPMQQANAWDKDGKDKKDGKDGKDGDSDNTVKIEQSNKCREAAFSCVNDIDGEITQNSGEDGGPDMDLIG
jgi:hypothetical protein